MMQEFVDSVDKKITSIISNVHTAVPAVVEKFNEDTCTVAVRPKMQYTMPDGTKMDYPLINNVPIVYPYSGSVMIGFPISKGDNCLLVFAEKNLDYWKYDRDTGIKRSFDLTDAIAIPNLNPKPNLVVKEAARQHAVIVKTKDITLRITDNNVTIAGDVAVEGTLTLNGRPVATLEEEG